MTELATPPRLDTSDMLAVHQVFRSALGSAPELISGAADADRVALVGTFYANVLHFLHSHHEGEDLLVWPRLLERCPADAASVERISAQHQDVTPAIERSQDLVGAWVESTDRTTGQDLTEALAVLRETLLSHLDEEERSFCPCAPPTCPPLSGGSSPPTASVPSRVTRSG